MSKQLDKAQVNHLRRLLGWVRCSEGVFQSPEEMVATMKGLAPHLGPIDDASKAWLVESYQKAASIPKYVRAALKALAPVVREAEGEIVDAVVERKLRYSRKQLYNRSRKMLRG